jgi:hypothetical protein
MMKLGTLIFILAFYFINSFAEDKIQPNPNQKELKMTIATNDRNVLFYINGKTVTSLAYQDFIKSLLPEQSNYTCKDQIGGGTTSYDLRDKSGNFHHVKDIVKGESRIISITPVSKQNNK